MFYINKTTCNLEMVSNYDHALMNEYYNKKYFSVWHQDIPRHTIDEIRFEFEKYEKTPGYEKNNIKRDKASIVKLKDNAALNDYPNMGLPAITVNRSNLRILPTNDRRFSRMSSSIPGSQFDRFQVSSIGVNVPIYISHMSRNKMWLLAETDYFFGWIPAKDVGYMDEPAINAWQNDQYIAVIKDKIPVTDETGQIVFNASIGAIFSKISEEPDRFKILTAVSGSDKRIRLKISFVSKEHAVLKPFKITTFNIAGLANELINEPYGWGGVDGNRDCSLMIRDLFAPFGIWLHRNSNEQGRQGGTFINLDNLSDEEKRRKILSEGIPYATLIWKKGHIMLYIGNYGGEPVIFHNFWSARMKNPSGKSNRRIVGRAAITTLTPGNDMLSGNRLQHDQLKNILGITLLIPKINP